MSVAAGLRTFTYSTPLCVYKARTERAARYTFTGWSVQCDKHGAFKLKPSKARFQLVSFIFTCPIGANVAVGAIKSDNLSTTRAYDAMNVKPSSATPTGLHAALFAMRVMRMHPTITRELNHYTVYPKINTYI